MFLGPYWALGLSGGRRDDEAVRIGGPAR